MNNSSVLPSASATALVTGGRGGIGREVLRRLRAAGVRVAVAGRDAGALAAVEADLRIEADTTSAQGAARALTAFAQAWGEPPAWLAHCVGSTLIAPLHRNSALQIGEVLRVNLESALYVLQAWVDARRALGDRAGGGSAVFVSSVVARVGVANHEAIAAAKGGVEALVRSAAATYAPLGLRVNAVAPGLTATPLTEGLLKVEAMREAAARQYPLGGVQTAEQVAEVMCWLLSDAAQRITGQVIPVDGGFCAVRPLVK